MSTTTPREPLSPSRLAEINARLETRIHSLVNRGAEICTEYQPREVLHSVPGCARCGYASDVHLLRDLLAALSAAERQVETSHARVVALEAQLESVQAAFNAGASSLPVGERTTPQEEKDDTRVALSDAVARQDLPHRATGCDSAPVTMTEPRRRAIAAALVIIQACPYDACDQAVDPSGGTYCQRCNWLIEAIAQAIAKAEGR